MPPVNSPSPSLPPPSGGGHTVTYAINGLVVVLAVVSVALRFYTRIFTRAGLRADDWLILTSLVTALAIMVLVLIGNTVDPNGLAMSENADPEYVYTPADHVYLRLSFACSVLYFTVAGSTKLGILLMYHRIFAVSTAFRYQLFVASALVLGWWVGCTVAALRKCEDLATGVMSTLNDPRYCFNFTVFWLAAGICELVLDAAILTMPVSVVVRMRYTMRQKFVVSGIFLLGALSIISGIVKTILAYNPAKRSLSYSNTEVWTALHTSIAILCASMPIFRPLVKRIANSYIVTRISNLLWPGRKNDSSSSSGTPSGVENGSGSDRNRNADAGPPSELSFIATDMVRDILKQRDSAPINGLAMGPIPEQVPEKEQETLERTREQAPQLPVIETGGNIELPLDADLEGPSPLSSHQRGESRGTDHGSERLLLLKRSHDV
ncbi:hypothetical protein F5Y04DRAFT_282892 [Hypomontagnella monticulosa]|nr:hypothetical protein F5Y04DRAFT_282892 [Hypomontagnella monticulosa]